MSDLELSVLIAAWNEGEALAQTVASCHLACAGVGHEIIVVDDGSTDGSADRIEGRFPGLRVVRCETARGTAAPKHQAAELARGDKLLFLDAHCGLEAPAIARLLAGIEATGGDAAIAPMLAELDPATWKILATQPYGFGRVNLLTMDYEPVRQRLLPQRPPYAETSALPGGCCMMARSLYFELNGFDHRPAGRALEDLDFGVRAWLSGCAVLCDPSVFVGHWQRPGHRDRYPAAQTLANKMRIAYTNLQDRYWGGWREQAATAMPTLWDDAVRIFDAGRSSAEERRATNLASRLHDEVWLAKRFGLPWPR